MTENKKNFFEMLDSKSALIVGVVTGFLVICTIGFIILLYLFLSGSNSASKIEVKDEIKNKQVANVDQKQVVSAPKSDKPVVELFVMSYCPFGLQMEKAMLPAWELLKNKADISIKFVSYAMHDLKEVEENTRQYCIQKEQNNKFISYLSCFNGSKDSKNCLSKAGVNENKLNSCVNASNKKYGIMDKYNDKSSWLSGRYPLYPIDKDLNDKYGVQGSPTLIINGKQISVSRNPEALKQVICGSFNKQPSECSKTLSTSSPASGFGTAVGTDNPSSGCGS